jgi:hypothetical protein
LLQCAYVNLHSMACPSRYGHHQNPKVQLYNAFFFAKCSRLRKNLRAHGGKFRRSKSQTFEIEMSLQVFAIQPSKDQTGAAGRI